MVRVFYQFIALIAVSVALQMLIPKPKQPKAERLKAPDTPGVGSDVALPIVFERGRVGGVLIYAKELRYIPTKKRSGKGAPKADIPEHYVAPLLGYALCCYNTVSLVRIEVNGEIFYDSEVDDGAIIDRSQKNLANHISFDDGERTNGIQSWLVQQEGTNNLPNFTNVNMLWLRDINLADYGNSYPTVQCIVKTKTPYKTLKTYVEGVLNFSKVNQKCQQDFGFDLITVNQRVDNIPFYGAAFTLDGSEPLTWIQPHIEAWNLALIQNQGRYIIDTLYPYDEANYEKQNIDVADLLSIEGEAAYSLQVTGSDSAPTQLALSYLDIDAESTPQVSYASLNRELITNAQSFDLKTILPRQLAQTLVERMLRAIWLKSKVLTFTMPLSSIKTIKSGSIIQFTNDEFLENLDWHVLSTSLGEKGFVEYSAILANSTQYIYSSSVRDIQTGDSTLLETSLSSTYFNLIDIPKLDSLETQRLKPYYVFDRNGYNNSVYIYGSQNNVNYEFIQTINSQNPIGIADSFLPLLDHSITHPGAEIEVVFDNFEVSFVSVSDADWLNGKQLFALDSCLFSYKEAIYIGTGSDNKWKFKGLISGFRGTNAFVSQITLESQLVFIKNEVNHNLFSLNTSIPNTYFGDYYSKKGYSNDDDITNNIETSTPYTHNKAKAPSVQKLRTKLFSTGDKQLRWVGRSAEDNAFALIDGVPQPMSNPEGSTYIIDIENSSNVLVRTISVTNQTFFNYTVAQQTVDGNLNYLDNLNYKVYQQSNQDLLGVRGIKHFD